MKMSRVLLCLLFSVPVCGVIDPNGPYYVDPDSGNDSNGGTSTGDAVQTLVFALENGTPTNEANDIIYLMTGDFDTVTLNNVAVNSSGWADSFRIKELSANDPNITAIVVSGTTDWVDFNDVDVTQADEQVEGRKGVYITTDHVRYSGDILGDWDEADSDDMTTYGIYIFGTAGEVNDVTVGPGKITLCNWGINTAGELGGTITIQDWEFENINQGPVQVDGDEGQDVIMVDGCWRTVQTVSRVNSGASGAPHGAAMSIRCSGVTARNCIWTQFGGSGGIRVYDDGATDGYNDILIENNLIYCATVSESFYIYDVNENVVVRNNCLQSTHQASTAFDPLRYDAAFLFNLYDTATTSGCKLYNNVILAYWSPAANLHTYVANGSNILWTVNIGGYQSSWGDASNEIMCTGDGSFNSPYDATWAEVNGNLFIGGGNFQANYYDDGITPPIAYDVFEPDAETLTVDAGNADNAPATDINGVARGSLPDRGPYEYVAAGGGGGSERLSSLRGRYSQ